LPPPSESWPLLRPRPSGSPAGGAVFIPSLGKIRPEFSNGWKEFFQALEEEASDFPTLGKQTPHFFQAPEKSVGIFPTSG
jgi:hypothetical protein